MEFDRQYFCDVKHGLNSLLDETKFFVQKYHGQPVQGSKAEIESTTCKDHTVVSTWSIGLQLIEFGGEHVSALTKLMTEPAEVIACCTCVRSMLESCSMSAWLLDPTINASERIKRLFAYRYSSMTQALKFLVSQNQPADKIDYQKQRIDLVEQEAISLGYAPVLSGKNVRIGIGQLMPGATAMIDDVLKQGGHYRVLSAVAHGQHWAITQIGYTSVAQDIDHHGTTCTAFAKSVNVEVLALLCKWAFDALAIPVWRLTEYFGWEQLAIEEVLENTADKLQIAVAPRFWRA